MAPGDEHRVVIERHGRSHRACCACGWTGHRWNELRPAEADAWHHVFGEESVVDLSTVAASDQTGASQSSRLFSAIGASTASDTDRKSPSLESLISRARAFADSPSPHRKQAVAELGRIAAEDRALVQAAITEISELLWRHSRRSASTADSEWLQLITAKRLLQETLDSEDAGSYR
jgi:hypothetical protein